MTASVTKSTEVDMPQVQNKAVIEVDGGFKILNLNSMCAYGLFDSRAEAEEAIAISAHADQLARCGQ